MQLSYSVTQRRPGFTFVELLCTLAIVTILAAILMTVLAQARERTRRPSRLAGARELGMALELYAQDYGGDAPQAAALQTATGCGLESDSWTSLNGGCQDLVAGLVWSRTSDETTGY